MSVTQPKGAGEGGGGASIDSLCKELTNRRKSLPRGFLNKRPERAPMIPAGFLLHLKGEKRGDVLGRVRIMAPNRLPTDRLKEHRALHVISLFAFALPPSLSLSPADLMHAGMSAQSQHFHKRTNERKRFLWLGAMRSCCVLLYKKRSQIVEPRGTRILLQFLAQAFK